MTELYDLPDDQRIERALAPLGTLDLGPEPPLSALDAGRLRSPRWQWPRRVLPALGLVAVIAVAVAVTAVHPTAPVQHPQAKNAIQLRTDEQLRSGIIGSWFPKPRDSAKRPASALLTFNDDGTFAYNDGCADSTGHWSLEDGRIAWSRVRSGGQDCPTGVAGVSLLETTPPVALRDGTLMLGTGPGARTFDQPNDLTAARDALVGDWTPQPNGNDNIPDRIRLALRPDETFAAFDGCRELRGGWNIRENGLFDIGNANGAPAAAGCTPFDLALERPGVPGQVQGNTLLIGDRGFTRTPLSAVGTGGWLPGYARLTTATAIDDPTTTARLVAAVKIDPTNGYRDQPFLAWHLADATATPGVQTAPAAHDRHYYLAGFGDRSCIIELYDPNPDGGGYRDGGGCTVRDPAPDPASPVGIDDLWVVPDLTQAMTFKTKDGTTTRVAAAGNVITAVPGADIVSITYTQPDGTTTTAPWPT